MSEASRRIDIADDFYEEEEILSFLGIKAVTLGWRRSQGVKCPPYIKLGNRYVYPKAPFRDWLNKQIKITK